MKRIQTIITPILALVIMASCGENKNCRVSTNTKVFSQEEQAALTPDCVIEILKKGNQEFVNNELTVRNNPGLIRDAANGQFPQAVILSCLDSRVPVEDVFHRAIGDVFVARNAGNIIDVDVLGSMEFACAASGAKLVMVLGHGSCGAMKHAIKGTELGNITAMLTKITPSVAETKANFEGATTAANIEFVDLVGLNNVLLMVERIRKESPVLAEMEQKGQIKIIGGWYDLHTGKVEFFDNI
jgi:carbonic anhydrase